MLCWILCTKCWLCSNKRPVCVHKNTTRLFCSAEHRKHSLTIFHLITKNPKNILTACSLILDCKKKKMLQCFIAEYSSQNAVTLYYENSIILTESQFNSIYLCQRYDRTLEDCKYKVSDQERIFFSWCFSAAVHVRLQCTGY